MKLSKKEIIVLIINLLIFIDTAIIAIFGVIYGAGDGQAGDGIIGINYFKPYTIDSNILLAVGSLLTVIFLFIKLFKKHELPKWLFKVYFVVTTSILLTFLTVFFFLFPVQWINDGFDKAISLINTADMFFFHVANPILAVLSFFLMKQEKLNFLDNLIAVIPMFIYSIVYLVNVVFLKNWSDFYGFTFGGHFEFVPLILIAMYGVTFLIGFILKIISKKKANA